MRLILIFLFCSPVMLWASPEDAQLKKEIRQKLIQEEKECADCTKMRPEVLEREVNRIFASEKNKRLKVHKSAQ